MSNALRKRLYKSQGGCCHWCFIVCDSPRRDDGQGARGSQPPTYFTIEHVHPREFGGQKPDNAVGACHRCNNLRNSMLRKLMVGKSIAHILIKEPVLKERLLQSILPYVKQKVFETAV